MKRRKNILQGVLIVILALVVVIGGRRLWENFRIQNMTIEKVSVTYGGGFGTRAETQTITITFEGSDVTLSAYVREHNSKPGEQLVQKAYVAEEEINEFYEYVRANRRQIRYFTVEEPDALDAGEAYITLNDERHGGYAVSNDVFREVIGKARGLIDADEYNAFIDKIYDYYGEERNG